MVLYYALLRRQNWLGCYQTLTSRNATTYKCLASQLRYASDLVANEYPLDINRTRNIGIIAHIDAGKTTTTERMLYYSGHTRRIGDVDDGSTVTDFLPAERARGITIQSAAISFNWPPIQNTSTAENQAELPLSALSHHINLIDTPGHADFTFEVRRSLRILDGAICILDGVAGVEAQTEQVWKQADEWQIPRIAYVNKLDRDGAAFGRTVREIGTKLGLWPALCQIPWWDGGKGRFCGIADVINLEAMLYEHGGDGKTIERFSFEHLQKKEPSLAAELKRARVALVELLSEHDDHLIEEFLEVDEDHLALAPTVLLNSLRRTVLKPKCSLIPVFCGASFRNIGVQPLLDAINNLLPSPKERPEPEVSLGHAKGSMNDLLEGDLAAKATSNTSGKVKKKPAPQSSLAVASMLKGCALAFKVVNDPRKGLLVYIRVYSGSIDRNAILYNTNLQNSERATTLLRMYANESIPVQSLEAGQIGVIAGSKFARTGDTLVAYASNKSVPPEPLDRLQLRPIHVPPPVFFASLEPNSLREEKDIHDKLGLLLREDPSLHVSSNEDTGQTLLSGMGELHLEIACDRLVNDLRANATMGKIAIGYRETFTRPSAEITKIFDKDKTNIKGKAGCTAKIEPLEHDAEYIHAEDVFEHEHDGNIIVINTPSLDSKGRPLNEEAVGLPGHLILREVQVALMNGALAALSRGPSYSYPVRGVKVSLSLEPELHVFGADTSYSALTAAARLATIEAFRDATSSGGSALMEPVMNVEIAVDDASLGNVIQDISSSRGGHIISLGDDEESEFESTAITGTIDAQKIYAPPDPFEFGASDGGSQRFNIQRSIKAKVPLKEMVGYLKHLRSMTGGRGTFVMSVDRFVKMTSQREKALITEMHGA